MVNGLPGLIFLGICAWNLLPYSLFLLMAWGFRTRYAPSLVVLVGTALASCLGIYAIADSFFVHPDPQGPLVFLFLPAAQLMGAAVFGLIAVIAVQFSRNR